MLLPLPHSLITLSAEQLRHVHLASAQLRYLARRGGEVVGALGFGASAWLVAGRDRFIGWSESSRRAGLHLVFNNNRFLIPPG